MSTIQTKGNVIKRLRAQIKDLKFIANERLECLRVENNKAYARGYNDARREVTNLLREAVGLEKL